MRGVQVFVTGLLVISAIVLLMGTLLEPIAQVAIDSAAVQDLGWATDATQIRDTILRWTPLLFIAYLVTFAGMWAFRRGRTTTTEVRRR